MCPGLFATARFDRLATRGGDRLREEMPWWRARTAPTALVEDRLVMSWSRGRPSPLWAALPNASCTDGTGIEQPRFGGCKAGLRDFAGLHLTQTIEEMENNGSTRLQRCRGKPRIATTYPEFDYHRLGRLTTRSPGRQNSTTIRRYSAHFARNIVLTLKGNDGLLNQIAVEVSMSSMARQP
jgi:hypothetical protein